MHDYTDAQPQRDGELIPDGTVATLELQIRPGNAGEEGLLRRSQDGLCEMLDVEFTVVDGPFAKRKFWERFVLAGTSDGHAKAAEISRGKLRAILELARGIKPDDVSPQARAARTVPLKTFDGMRFIGKIGIEKGKDKGNGGGNYPDRNILLRTITPDRKDWHAVEQAPPPPKPPGNAASAQARHCQAGVGIMSAVTRLKAKAGFSRPSATAVEDAWQRQATCAAIEGCRKILEDGVIPPARRSAGWATPSGVGWSPRCSSPGFRPAPNRRSRSRSTPNKRCA